MRPRAAAVLLCLPAAACTQYWTAAVRLEAGAAGLPGRLSLEVASERGAHIVLPLAGPCTELRVPQHPKLPNRISVTLLADGAPIASAVTHDLSQRALLIRPAGTDAAVRLLPAGTC